MKVLRFLVRVDPAWNVVVTCPSEPTFTAARAMRKATWKRRGFPLPTEADALAVAGDAARKALFADGTGALAAQHHDRIAQREPRSGDIERFGHLLFHALLGSTLWTAIVACADKIAGAVLIELGLAWDAGDTDLNRLNWELMRSDAGFLARGGSKRVTITRIVASPAPGSLTLGATPRVLFVAGSKLSDGKIRPLAEYLSFLQALRPQQRDALGAGPRAWQSEIVLDATPRRLREAVVRFEPDVVHFVCHGAIHGGKTVLELQPDAEGSGYRSADQIVDLITRNAVLPSVVVLSACYSGTSDEDLPREVVTEQHTGPFAAQIVARGVPIVVGMAGRIADSACRLFTRRFSEALIAGEPIVLAVEEGRRAAFSQGEPPDLAADWAFPTLFLADSVPPDVQTAPPAPSVHLVESWLDGYDVRAISPVFCGRFELLEAFATALVDPAHRVLAVYTESNNNHEHKFGKTRLLRELTVRALGAGHVPCVMSFTRDRDPPRDLRALLQEIGAAVLSAREVLKIASPSAEEQIPLLLDKKKSHDLVAQDPRLVIGIKRRIESDQARSPDVLSPQVVRLAVEHDLGLLIADARAHYPTILGANSRAVLLLDDVDDYGDALDPLLRTVIGNSGLGTPSEPFPVVLTFYYGGLQKDALREVYERKKGAWMVHALNEFSVGEDLLAYERLLMNPFSHGGSPDQALIPRAFNYRLDAKKTARGERGFQKILMGVPSLATSDLFHAVAELAQEDDFVVSADDDAILRALRRAPS